MVCEKEGSTENGQSDANTRKCYVHSFDLSQAYTVQFSSDFEPNFDSCDCFLSRAEFQLCLASFVVQCSFSVQGETRSDKSLPTGNRTVG